MGNKLTNIFNIAVSLQRDIKALHDDNDFFINDEPCLSFEFSEFNVALAAMKDRCNKINLKVDNQLAVCEVDQDILKS